MPRPSKHTVALAAAALACCLAWQSGTAASGGMSRPKIIGVAHIALETNDMKAEQEFYGHVLGYASFPNKPGGDGVFFKVNDHQYIEVFPDLKSETQDRLNHIAFYTDNAKQLRDYLAGHKVDVPASIKPGSDGNLSFKIKDPEGHTVEFVEYKPHSFEGKNFGKLLPETRISKRIIHVGFTVQDRAAEDAFFKDILGFEVMWYGGRKEGETDYVDMRVPDGSDWLEYMLNVHNPTPKTLGVMHHLALGVDSIQPAYHTVLDRGHKPGAPPKLGVDGKWQLNLYDANLTRAELMEFEPVQTPCCGPMLKAPIIIRQ